MGSRGPSPDQLLFAEEGGCLVTAGLGVLSNLSDHWVETHSGPFCLAVPAPPGPGSLVLVNLRRHGSRRRKAIPGSGISHGPRPTAHELLPDAENLRLLERTV